MLQKLFSSKLRVDLLSLFFGRPDEEFYVREVEKILGEDVGNISRELKNLEGTGLLISRKKGNLKYYLLDRKYPVYDELRSIILKTRGAAGVLQGVLSGIKGVEFAFIYGSFATGQETARSDIDLMVIGKVPLERLIKSLKEPEEILGREINPSLYDRREIEKRLSEKEPFINRVIREPKIMLIGDEDGLRKLADKRADEPCDTEASRDEMKKSGRYKTSDLPEAQYEPGSRGHVLLNLKGIAIKREMDRVEAQAHIRALREYLVIFSRDHRFSSADIVRMHRIWLGDIYGWAGRYRHVNISKGGFTFAVASQIPKLMNELEKGPLKRFTPCLFTERTDIIEALAVVHTELVLIHPFREGNGRIARMLAMLMAVQAGYPPLDFGGIRGKKKEAYFAAIQAGLDRNYEPMKGMFSEVIERTVSKSWIP